MLGIFPNEKAITRLAGALLLEQNEATRGKLDVTPSFYTTPRARPR